MRKILFDLYKKYKWAVIIETVVLIINVYLVASPSRIVGNMISLLYDINANRNAISKKIPVYLSKKDEMSQEIII